MGIFDQLKAIGCKLKIIQSVPAEKPALPRQITTRTISLNDLMTEIQAQNVRDLAQLPQQLSAPLDEIFKAAGIDVAVPWTIDRLKNMLHADEHKSKDRSAVQKAILECLTADKTDVEALVKDAVARDQALDAFEITTREKLDRQSAARKTRAAEIDRQIQALQRERDDLTKSQKNDEEHFRQWHVKKVACEKEMAWALGFLLEKPIVSIDEDENSENCCKS